MRILHLLFHIAFLTPTDPSIVLLLLLSLNWASGIPPHPTIIPLTNDFIALLEDESRYNKYATPTQEKGISTNVSMSMFIEGISSFSAQTMDYQLDMYFYQEWDDKRLRHNGTGPLLIRDKKIFNKLWHPDIYFANARQASFQEITEDNFYVWIYPNGTVWYDCRISLVAICMMDLWKYPLDAQTCELRILSYAYPESHIRLRWSTKISPPIDRNQDIKMPDMRLVDISTGECNGNYTKGVWSCMTAVFYVEREMLHHVIQTYLPTSLIVVISWFNFWLDIDTAPARVSLSIMTLLTIATQANAVKLALPEVSYMKAIDAWMGMCMAFVFAVMVEYTIAHFAKNQEFPLFSESNQQPPLLVDSETLNSIVNAAASATPNYDEEGQQTRGMDAEMGQRAMEEEGFMMTSAKELNGQWHKRRRVCRVLSNGHLCCSSSFAERGNVNNKNSLRIMGSSFNASRSSKRALSEMSSNAAKSDDERIPKLGRNQLSPVDFLMDPRLARLSSLTADYNGTIGGAVLRRNCFRESAKVFKSQLTFQFKERAQNIKRTLGQLRGREMAIKIDEKSRIVFPSAFILMNICYWSYYMILN